MLRARVVTALALAAVMIAGTLYLPPVFMSGLLALVALLGGFEWAALAGLGRGAVAAVYAAGTLALAVALYRTDGALLTVMLQLAAAWWCLAGLWIVAYQWHGAPCVRAAVLLGAGGILALVPALLALWWLLAHAPDRLLVLFAIVWSADILAYAGGRRYGRRPLASRVSPGKTWEGLAAALIGTVLLAALLLVVVRPAHAEQELLLVAVTVLAAAAGDLLESLLKRLRGVKDSGTLLPGHGGVLDRVDSILAAAPVHVLGLMIIAAP